MPNVGLKLKIKIFILYWLSKSGAPVLEEFLMKLWNPKMYTKTKLCLTKGAAIHFDFIFYFL